VRIELPEHTRFYYPDVQVVCSRNPGNERFQEHPVVVKACIPLRQPHHRAM
jgi:hypothetical protein